MCTLTMASSGCLVWQGLLIQTANDALSWTPLTCCMRTP